MGEGESIRNFQKKKEKDKDKLVKKEHYIYIMLSFNILIIKREISGLLCYLLLQHLILSVQADTLRLFWA